MPSVALHFLHCAERLAAQICEFLYREVTELASHLPCIQEQADVGGRDSFCDSMRLLLQVVGDQPIIFVGTELGEVTPSTEGGTAKKKPVFVGSFAARRARRRSEEHTSELQSRFDLVCRLLLEKKKKISHKEILSS